MLLQIAAIVLTLLDSSSLLITMFLDAKLAALKFVKDAQNRVTKITKLSKSATKHAFVCGCGKCHFNGRCSVEFVGEMKYNDVPQVYQHFFWCDDCCCDEKGINNFICRACAEKCHSGHRIVDCGIQKGACSCSTNNLGGNCKCKILKFEDNSLVDNCSAEISESQIMQ